MADAAIKTTWKADTSHSEVIFKVRHMMMTNVKGEFRTFDATLISDGDDFSDAKVEVEIDTNSILTNSEKRDEHLKSADFFDAENHPKITFISTGMEKKDNETFILKGDLTIRDITKPVALEAEFGGVLKDPWGGERAGFSIKGAINRKEFELNWNAALESGGVLVGDTVKIDGEVQFVKQG